MASRSPCPHSRMLTWVVRQVPQSWDGFQGQLQLHGVQCMTQWKCLLRPGQGAWEQMQPTFAISALGATSLKAKGKLGDSCNYLK